MFRMYGRTVQVLKYKVSYTKNEEEQTYYAATEEEAQEIADRVSGTVSPLLDSDDSWMDGIEVADVPDTYSEAMRIYNIGQVEYERLIKEPTIEEDTMSMFIDHEYRILMLELGLTE